MALSRTAARRRVLSSPRVFSYAKCSIFLPSVPPRSLALCSLGSDCFWLDFFCVYLLCIPKQYSRNGQRCCGGAFLPHPTLWHVARSREVIIAPSLSELLGELDHSGWELLEAGVCSSLTFAAAASDPAKGILQLIWSQYIHGRGALNRWCRERNTGLRTDAIACHNK